MGATYCRWSAVAAGLLAVAAAGRAEAYGVRLRWKPVADSPVTGYRVHVWAGDGVPEPTVDVGLPAGAADGTLSSVVTGLDPHTEYALAVSATLATGAETPPSNIVRIGYAQVASVIDSDGDGVKDAADACPATPAGAAVGATGCTCTQLACDDGNPCNGVEICADGACLPGDPIDCTSAAVCATDAECGDRDACTTAERCVQGRCAHATVRCDDAGPCAVATCDPTRGCTSTPLADGIRCADPDPCLPTGTCIAGTCTLPATDVAPAELLVRRFVVRPVRGRRAWRVLAMATSRGSGRTRLDPRDVIVELWAAGAMLRYQASVAAGRFAPRPRRLVFVASAEHTIGGLRRLEISEHDGVRTIHLEAVVPEAILPGGAATPLTWLVWFGDQCARDIAMTCDTLGRGFVCPSAR